MLEEDQLAHELQQVGIDLGPPPGGLFDGGGDRHAIRVADLTGTRVGAIDGKAPDELADRL